MKKGLQKLVTDKKKFFNKDKDGEKGLYKQGKYIDDDIKSEENPNSKINMLLNLANQNTSNFKFLMFNTRR